MKVRNRKIKRGTYYTYRGKKYSLLFKVLGNPYLNGDELFVKVKVLYNQSVILLCKGEHSIRLDWIEKHGCIVPKLKGILYEE